MEYGESKFAASAREASRSRFPIPPASTRCDDIPTREEIATHLQALSKNKAPGLSGLPVEAYLAASHSTEDLIDLVQFIFKHEKVPEDMVVGEFVMLWKGKGGGDDLSQYRAVCLEEIGLKLVASIMLARLSAEVGETQRSKTTEEGSSSFYNTGLFAERSGYRKEKYLPRTQAVFRKGRSTRDNSFALRTLINLAIELRTRLCVTFLDLRQAFDCVSHACLEEALRDAGASDKSPRLLHTSPNNRVGGSGTQVFQFEFGAIA